MKFGPDSFRPFAGEIEPRELESMTEDIQSLRIFERRYGLAIWVGLIALVGSFFYLWFHGDARYGIGGLVLGFISLGWGIRHMARNTPVSRISGLPMKRYKLSVTPEGAEEVWIYLDRVSRTYFRYTFSESSD